MSLRMDANCNIDLSVEDTISWGEHYLAILDKLKKNEDLSDSERIHVMLLLHKNGKERVEHPEKFIMKSLKGRPNKNTKQRVRKYITVLFELNLAKDLMEARQKTATHFRMSYDAVDKQSRNMNLKKYLEKKDGNK